MVLGKHLSIRSYAHKADANAAPRDALGQQETGYPGRPREGKVAFGAYVDEWVAGRHDLAMRTKRDYEDVLRLRLKSAEPVR